MPPLRHGAGEQEGTASLREAVVLMEDEAVLGGHAETEAVEPHASEYVPEDGL